MPLGAARIARLKCAYTTRHVPPEAVHTIATNGRPQPGDLVVARVTQINQQTKLELRDGRRATMFIGDEILVAYGNRYAPAQYHALIPESLGPCDLVAAGGVAATALAWHSDKRPPSRLEPVGLVVDSDGRCVNLGDWQLSKPRAADKRPYTVAVVGTSMDSGKTTTAAGLIHGLTNAGYRVGAAKITGTGAGGDIWSMEDAGAWPVLDFTAAGMASTYGASIDTLIRALDLLTGHLVAAGVDVVVMEIADGIYQDETAALLASHELADSCDAFVFAACDAIGAVAGVGHLRALGLPVRAASGLLTASPLATREAEVALDVPVLGLGQLLSGDHALVPPNR